MLYRIKRLLEGGIPYYKLDHKGGNSCVKAKKGSVMRALNLTDFLGIFLIYTTGLYLYDFFL